jgi:hypothetical protein
MRCRYYPKRIEPRTHTRQFDQLTVDEKAKAVKRLAKSCVSDNQIADLTGLSSEAVRRILAQP